MSNKSGTSNQAVSLPSGGGAVKGIGETFSPDLFTGTGNFAVPIAAPSGRNGFHPDLRLTYSTGNGNSAFGLGWDVSVPRVTRRTAKGVPRYDEGDTFVLSGAEELVPVAVGEHATRFRPRTEGLFSRIDRLTQHAEGEHWRVSSPDGLTHTYGPGADGGERAVLADPSDPSRIAAWHLSRTLDRFGNRILYDYEHDTGNDFDQLYLRRVRYADHDGLDGGTGFLASVAFVYDGRPDAFSDRRAGFEVRTRRRCTRIEVRSHPGEDVLVRTLHLRYVDERVAAGELPETALPANGVSLLSQVRVVGHDGDDTQELPPLEFDYTRFDPARRRFEPLDADGGAMPAESLADERFEMVDLFGNGLPDLVRLGDGTAQFWRNRGGGRFDAPQLMDEVPVGVELADPGVRFGDLNGNGRPDLLVNRLGGYFPLSFEGRWSEAGFTAYDDVPTFLADEDVRMADLDGDGVVDAVRLGDRPDLFLNDPESGWQPPRTGSALPDDPGLRFTDARVKLADLGGDGLQDVVFVEQGRLRYWPGLGHGRWGPPVTMEASPVFDDSAPVPGIGFDPERVLLADLDGDGLDDVVHLEPDRVTVWINQGGNRFADPVTVTGTPQFTEPDAVRAADMLAGGTTGLLWTADQASASRDAYRFLDLTGGTKPYVLDTMDNGMGAVTRVTYAPSTRFLRDDEEAGRGWATPLPFPVQVVARVETDDVIAQGRLVTEYRYHDGYWDGAEREFRGFGMVEKRDAETFTQPHDDDARFSPPTVTKTWFHLGPVGDEFAERTELDLSGEFWAEDPPALDRSALDAFLAGLGRRDRADALRALKGEALRTETYADDGDPRADRPYTVTETVYGLREEDPPDGDADRLRVFFPHELARRETQWERGTDPMTRLTFFDDHDDYGHARGETVLAVRRGRDYRRSGPAGEPYLAKRTVTAYAIRDDDVYMVDRVCAETVSEIRNDGAPSAFALHDAVLADEADLRLAAHTVHHYDGEAFVGFPAGEVGDFGARVRTQRLALTEELLTEAYGEAAPPYLTADGDVAWTGEYPEAFRGLVGQAGYVFHDGAAPHLPRGFYVQQDRTRYDVQTPGEPARGLARFTMDPLSNVTETRYDSFGLLPVVTLDPVGLRTATDNDHRVGQPHTVTDPNGNRSQVTFTPLGLVADEFVRGQDGSGDRDRPHTTRTYDLLAFHRTRDEDHPEPVHVRTTKFAHHDTAEVPDGDRDRVVEEAEFSDGFGRLVQARRRAPDLRFGDEPFGHDALDPSQATTGGTVAGRRRPSGEQPNVVVSGATVYDHKGNPVEQFEPFFAHGLGYAPPNKEQRGRRVSAFHDPLGRTVRAVHPDGSEQRAVLGVPGRVGAADVTRVDGFDPSPWEVFTYDPNDNAARSHGDARRGDADTPTSYRLDPLGRTAATVERLGSSAADELVTATVYDILGNVTSVTDSLRRRARRSVHDMLGNELRSESLDAGVHRVTYDAAGNEVEHRDGKGALSLHAYDPLGRDLATWARDGTGGNVTLRERVVYGDAADAGLPVGDAPERNLLGQPLRHYDEAGLVVCERYDVRGAVAEEVRRVFREDVAEGDPVDWEPAGGRSVEEHADRLLDAREYRTSMVRDALERLAELRYPQDPGGHRATLRPRYDEAGGLVAVSLDDDVIVEHVAYDAKGQRTLVVLGNGVMTRYAYDPDTFRLRRVRSERFRRTGGDSYDATGPALTDCAYDYDLVGNITAVHDRTPGCGVPGSRLGEDALDRTFTYDPLYRLVTATGRECDTPAERPPWDSRPVCTDVTRTRAYTRRYTYDRVGNVAEVRHAADGTGFTRRFEHLEGANRLVSTSVGEQAAAYAYDGCGNLVRENTDRSYGWDHSDQLATFEVRAGDGPASVRARYRYDSAGRRVHKVVRNGVGKVESTVYVGDVFEHHRWRHGSRDGENAHLHVLDDDRRVALIRTGDEHPDEGGPAVQYHLVDRTGAYGLVVDGDGQVTNREEFYPYGQTSFGGFTRKRYRFTGAERDEESGLSAHGVRQYAPWLARWTSPDPAGSADGENRYVFTRDNPLRFADPSGTQSETQEDESVFLGVEVEFGGDLHLGVLNGGQRDELAGDDLPLNLWGDAEGGGEEQNLRPAGSATVSVTTVPPSLTRWLGPGGFDPPGNQPHNLYVGITAHDQIAAYYRAAHPDNLVWTNHHSVSAITGAASLGGLKLRLAKPDIYNATTGEVYEIKPWKPRAAMQALADLHTYLAVFDAAGVSVRPGRRSDPGVTGAVPGAGGITAFSSPTDGVILYHNIPWNRRPVQRRWVRHTSPVPSVDRETVKKGAFWATVGGAVLFAAWKLKGCWAGLAGCAVGFAW